MNQLLKFSSVCVMTATIAATLPQYAQAVIFGQVSTAQTLQPGTMDIGGFVSVFENSTLLFGQYRHSLFSAGDFGIQGGFVDPELGDMGLAIGGDMKFQVMRRDEQTPFDLALNPRIAYLDMDRISIFSAGGSVVISRDYVVEQGYLAPYGAVNLRMENVDIDSISELGPDDDTDLQISAIAGLRWDISDLIDLLGEVVLDDEIGVTVGVNFKL